MDKDFYDTKLWYHFRLLKTKRNLLNILKCEDIKNTENDFNFLNSTKPLNQTQYLKRNQRAGVSDMNHGHFETAGIAFARLPMA